MPVSNSFKIGKVKVVIQGDKNKSPEYSDGDVENEILDIFKQGLSDADRRRILNDNPSWPIRYHLAYERGNIINWYNFKDGARILEIGSGCGAVTEALVKNKNIKVVANELSERRATINAHRNKQCENLEIVIGNLQEYKPKEKFDYVVCIGVLEYAGTFINADKPYNEFINLLKSFLKPNGVILLAIENKLGLKYLSGAREDHTGGFFDGINNYPQTSPVVRTFGRDELTAILNSSNLSVNKFYYPFPDYKLPKVVYSDDYLPNSDKVNIPKGMVPAPNYDQSREFLFNEQLFAYAIENNNLFGQMANSFFVEACIGKPQLNKQDNIVFSISSENRQSKFRIKTKGVRVGDNIIFRKQASTQDAKEHVNELVRTHNLLTRHLKNNGDQDLVDIAPVIDFNETTGIVDFKYINGKNAERLLLDAILVDDTKLTNELLDKFQAILGILSVKNTKELVGDKKHVFKHELIKNFNTDSLTAEGLIDYNLDNFIVEEQTGKWWLIDYEWKFSEPIPTDYIYNRALMYFCWMNKNMILSRLKRQTIYSNNYWAIPEKLVERSKNISSVFNKVFDVERDLLQPYVTGSQSSRVDPTKLMKMKEDDGEQYFIDRANNQIQDKDNQIQDKDNQIQELEARLQHVTLEQKAILNSKSYKTGRLIGKPYRSINRLRRKIK